MIKAVFLDYTGTILQEGGPDIEEMTMRCAKNSNVKDPRAMMEWWFRNLRIEEERRYLHGSSEKSITGTWTERRPESAAAAEYQLLDVCSALY